MIVVRRVAFLIFASLTGKVTKPNSRSHLPGIVKSPIELLFLTNAGVEPKLNQQLTPNRFGIITTEEEVLHRLRLPAAKDTHWITRQMPL